MAMMMTMAVVNTTPTALAAAALESDRPMGSPAVCLSVCLCVCLSVCLSVRLSVSLAVRLCEGVSV